MIRVLIIEDSLVVTRLLTAIIDREADMTVIGGARDGAEGVRMAEALQPDLITMDIRMPVMDGFEVTRHIMATRPTPIVVISSNVDDDELRITFRAIEEGALAVIEKPEGLRSPNFASICDHIVGTIRAMAEVKLVRRFRHSLARRARMPGRSGSHEGCKVLGLACSTGGPQALHAILRILPGDLPFPIVVVQHISSGFVGGLVKWLADVTKLRILLAEDGAIPQPGQVLFAPDDHHIRIRSEQGKLMIGLDRSQPINRFRPSGNPLFTSLALAAPGRSAGGVLTGMGNDGATGLLAMRNAGCHTFVQDQASSIVFGMPGEALALDAAEAVISLDRMADHILSLANPRPAG
ncbi:MAG: chemotaxis-specific protein-glutamate methyltransferase CheB [Magnetococcales bacterium]|nr:chemotaxis-specific protein-glutamate methyltransferase CheB [Magnetococcales bacterium]